MIVVYIALSCVVYIAMFGLKHSIWSQTQVVFLDDDGGKKILLLGIGECTCLSPVLSWFARQLVLNR